MAGFPQGVGRGRGRGRGLIVPKEKPQLGIPVGEDPELPVAFVGLRSVVESRPEPGVTVGASNPSAEDLRMVTITDPVTEATFLQGDYAESDEEEQWPQPEDIPMEVTNSDVKITGQEDELGLRVGAPNQEFLLPTQIKIPPAGVDIEEGERLLCSAGEIVSPSEFYLTGCRNFPQDLNQFIDEMTKLYKSWFAMLQEDKFMLFQNPENIQPGCYVACFSPVPPSPSTVPEEPGEGQGTEVEVVRARVIREVSQADPQKLKIYRVFLIDLGMYAEVGLTDMLFLHKSFTEEPAWAIKCRFALDKYYDPYHDPSDLEHYWDDETIDFMVEVLKSEQRRLTVQFVRRVEDPAGITPLMIKGGKERKEVVQVEPEEPEMIWEIHILGIDPPHESIHVYLERLIIRKTMGGYMRLRQLKKQEKADEKKKGRSGKSPGAGVAAAAPNKSSRATRPPTGASSTSNWNHNISDEED